VRVRAAAAWARWEETVLSLEPNTKPTSFSGPVHDDLLALVRICAHYYANYGWLADGELIRDAGKLAGIPGVMVHGRLDLSCPVSTAYELVRAWPGADLFVCDQSGHRGSEAKGAYVRAALDRFADRC
jgi:proline iminopeptidase